VFLDDDDAFAPAHVETLVAAAANSRGARVAYSATAVVEPDGKARMVIGADFNRLHLFVGNYMQVGAALFSRSLVPKARASTSASIATRTGTSSSSSRSARTSSTRPADQPLVRARGRERAGRAPTSATKRRGPFHEIVVSKWAARAASLDEYLRRNPPSPASSRTARSP
jgi:hypothetical protein